MYKYYKMIVLYTILNYVLNVFVKNVHIHTYAYTCMCLKNNVRVSKQHRYTKKKRS